jgi:hypothetical protein
MIRQSAILLVAGFLLLSCSCSKNSERILFLWDDPQPIPSNLPIRKSATCHFKKDLAVTYTKNLEACNPNCVERVEYSETDTAPSDTDVSFLDLDTKGPKVQSNGGQGILTVIRDSEASITLLNHPEGGDGTEMYTIFKDTGIVIYNQQKRSFVGPLGVLQMGYCN